MFVRCRLPLNNLEYSRTRLDQILRRRRLCFNPYKYSDRQLLEIASTTGWGGMLDIVQVTTVTFTRLREVSDTGESDGIFMTVADNPEEIFLHICWFIKPVTAPDSLQPVRSRAGKKVIRTREDVENLVGKTYFVSRKILAKDINSHGRCAFQMYRLKGNLAKDAALIRTAICDAKIEMLERLLNHVELDLWLDCKKGFFDYETRVRRANEKIRHFSDTPIPND